VSSPSRFLSCCPSGKVIAILKLSRCRNRSCRGTSLIRNLTPLGPYSRPTCMPRALWWSSLLKGAFGGGADDEDTLQPVSAVSAAILCTGGPDVIRKEAWLLCR
jgi:hypothetical protein